MDLANANAAMRAIVDALSPDDRRALFVDLFRQAHPHTSDEDERGKIAYAIELAGSVSHAARMLGVGVRYLRRRMRQLGFPPHTDRGRPPNPILDLRVDKPAAPR